jgi:hypothetical protein
LWGCLGQEAAKDLELISELSSLRSRKRLLEVVIFAVVAVVAET